MSTPDRDRRAASFSGVAATYADHRPGYPPAAVEWLLGSQPARVLELGAGTGKLTATLCSLGHDVLATDPSAEMLSHLHRTAPPARIVRARAEKIPLPWASVDVVVAAQAHHWFDGDRALPEVARVLRPGGTLALVWNVGDLKVPWVRRFFELLQFDPAGRGEDPFTGSDVFSLTGRHVVRHWQKFFRQTMVGFAASTSYAATLPTEEREDLFGRVTELYDSYGRGPDGLLMPWISYCYRGRVQGLVSRPPAQRAPVTDDGLLIDFN